ncbi:hypothetical protein, partial [Bacillus sp. JJ722]|uniref:hypothetical protein n=1 Tax=Bacillus sp. JJ722 TaxID=3122973 RepID=UPI002FFF0CBC
TLDQLKELSQCTEIDYIESKEDLINKFLANQKLSKVLQYLKEFQNKKKKSIDTIYEWVYSESEVRYDLSTLNKLYHLYIKKPTVLFDVFTLHKWLCKSSGEKYIYQNNITQKQLDQFTTNKQYETAMTNDLHTNSKDHEYKIVSTSTFTSKKIIVLIYKQMSDVVLPDFDGNKRNKKISEIMFEINLNDKSISIKTTNKKDEHSLLKYFNENLNTKLQKFTMKPFKGFTTEIFQQLLSNEDISENTDYNMYISGISFNSSNLWKSPVLSFDLKDDDVWPAVVEGHEKGMIRPKSLKDIKYIRLSFKDMSSKKIYTMIEANGDITFRLQDANLTIEQIDKINGLFKSIFGVPINQPISSQDFIEGKADKLDFILKHCSPSLLSDNSIFEELIDEQLITKNEENGYSCTNPECSVLYNDEPENDCEKCGNDEFEFKNRIRYELNFKRIKSLTKKKLSSWSKNRNINFLSDTSITIYSKKYNLMNIETSYGSIQILITKDLLPTRTLNRFRKLMTPTIIVYIGHHEADFIHQNTDSIFPTNFGKIYAYEEADFNIHLDY